MAGICFNTSLRRSASRMCDYANQPNSSHWFHRVDNRPKFSSGILRFGPGTSTKRLQHGISMALTQLPPLIASWTVAWFAYSSKWINYLYCCLINLFSWGWFAQCQCHHLRHSLHIWCDWTWFSLSISALLHKNEEHKPTSECTRDEQKHQARTHTMNKSKAPRFLRSSPVNV